jgi:hypothetical protein
MFLGVVMKTRKMKSRTRERRKPARRPARRTTAPRVKPAVVLELERQAAQLANLREAVLRQTESLTAIASASVSPMASTDVFDSTLRHAHAVLARSIQAVSAIADARPYAPSAPPVPLNLDPFIRTKTGAVPYDRVRERVSAAVRVVVPEKAVTVVVSRGDQSLLDACSRDAWHFPQNDDGMYAGYHPAGSAQAIRHLEALRQKGGEFLVFPATASWWLDYYGALRRHLDSRYRLMFAEAEHCAIYDLRDDQLEAKDRS